MHAMENDEMKIKPEHIIEKIARFYSLSPDDIRGNNMSKEAACARKEAMWIIRTMTDATLADIRELFAGQDYQSIQQSLREVEKALKQMGEQ